MGRAQFRRGGGRERRAASRAPRGAPFERARLEALQRVERLPGAARRGDFPARILRYNSLFDSLTRALTSGLRRIDSDIAGHLVELHEMPGVKRASVSQSHR